jgi:hypothetical protein
MTVLAEQPCDEPARIGGLMTTYTKQDAAQLCEELIEATKRAAESIAARPEDSPLTQNWCAMLQRALSEVRPIVPM